MGKRPTALITFWQNSSTVDGRCFREAEALVALSISSSPFMVPEVSLPSSQEPASGL